MSLHKYETPEFVTQFEKRFSKEGAVLFEEFLDNHSNVLRKMTEFAFTQEYTPVLYSYKKYSGPELTVLFSSVLVFLDTLFPEKEFSVELLFFDKGDYTLLHDDIPKEKGVLAFLDLSQKWNEEWGGYLAIDQEPLPTKPNALLVADGKNKRWFIKRINHYAESQKILAVFRETSS